LPCALLKSARQRFICCAFSARRMTKNIVCRAHERNARQTSAPPTEAPGPYLLPTRLAITIKKQKKAHGSGPHPRATSPIRSAPPGLSAPPTHAARAPSSLLNPPYPLTPSLWSQIPLVAVRPPELLGTLEGEAASAPSSWPCQRRRPAAPSWARWRGRRGGSSSWPHRRRRLWRPELLAAPTEEAAAAPSSWTRRRRGPEAVQA
jgi:hypothetical protein